MTEKSIFWTTGALGDGAAEYTMAELTRWLRQTYLSDNTDEGVLKGYGGGLAVSGVASPVSIASGGALVYGFPYWSTAASTLAIPSPVGDTRIDRVVLEVDWAAQTVRIARVAGAEGGAAPALTQIDGTTWQVSLAQASIAVGGVITVTDERVFVHPNWEIEIANFSATDTFSDDGIDGGNGTAYTVDVSDFVGDCLEDDGAENLDVRVDDTTIEIAADVVQAKAGGLDNSYFVDRARTLWIPATECYNSTGANYENQALRGWEMVDAATCTVYASAICPPGWAGNWDVYAVFNIADAGRMYVRLQAAWGSVGEAYNTHTTDSGNVFTAELSVDLIYKDATSYRTLAVAEGDVIVLQFSRLGADVSNTVDGTVYFVGFVVEATADM